MGGVLSTHDGYTILVIKVKAEGYYRDVSSDKRRNYIESCRLCAREMDSIASELHAVAGSCKHAICFLTLKAKRIFLPFDDL
jgi:hypothetical protein